MKIGCIIMASGEGVRFGKNKLLEPLCSKPLIEWVTEVTEGIFEHRVVVTRHKEIKEICEKKNIECILHSLPHRSDTVRIGLEAISDGIDGALFFPADQPLLLKKTLEKFLAASDCEHIIRLSFNGASSSPTLFPRKFFDELSTLPEGKGGGYLIKKYPDSLLSVEADNALELFDVDTKEDLEELNKYLNAK